VPVGYAGDGPADLGGALDIRTALARPSAFSPEISTVVADGMLPANRPQEDAANRWIGQRQTCAHCPRHHPD